jgi:hypothetical protein
VACWVSEVEGRVADVAVAVKGLGIGRVGDEGVGADETCQSRQIPTRIHVNQANVRCAAAQIVVAVSRVAHVCQTRRRFRAPVAKGIVPRRAAPLAIQNGRYSTIPFSPVRFVVCDG